LEEGIEGSSMISYNYLTPEERFAMAHYIRTEFVPEPPVVTDEELIALDQIYDLSAGTSIPAQIPVKAAMNIIVKEVQFKHAIIESTVEELRSSLNEITKLFNNVTSDKVLALSALLNSDEWQSNENSLIKFLTDNVNQNGFNGNIFNLSNAEWSRLYSYLKSVLD
jgi:hypothetical protein